MLRARLMTILDASTEIVVISSQALIWIASGAAIEI